MIKIKLLLASLLIFSLSPLAAQACPSGDLQSITYIRRPNPSRCEGIQRTDVGGGVNLISLATRGIDSYSDTLSLQIPNLNIGTPNLRVQSLTSNYLLNNLSLEEKDYWFSFLLNTYVLNQASVPVESLRALAVVEGDSQPIFLPVILGESSQEYEFVLYTSQRAKFTTLEIRRNGKVFAKSPRQNPESGEVSFRWDGRNAPAGRYELRLVAEQEQIGKPPQKYSRTYTFEHNPNWLQ